jgi:hypothetical protein
LHAISSMVTEPSEILAVQNLRNVRTRGRLAQGSRNLGSQQTAFDAEMKAIEQVVEWFQGADQRHMTIHSDSTSAIAKRATPP